MNKRQLIIVGIIIVIIATGVMAVGVLSKFKEPPKKVEEKDIKRYAKVQNVNYKDMLSSVKASGRLASQQQVDLISEVSGKILPGKISLKKGQSFRKGDLLVKIYDSEARLTLKSKKSRFLNAVANLLPDFKIDFPQRLHAWKTFFSNINLEENLPDLPYEGSDQEKIYLASRNILSDYYTIKSDEIRLNKYSIYAPFNGSYTDVMLETGSVANMGSRLAKMIRTDKLEMEVPVEITNSEWIQVGDEVKVTNQDGSKHWIGKVIRTSDFVDPQTQSINIYVKINDSKEFPLYKGQYLEAEFPGIMHKNVMEILRKAVFNHNEVYIVVDGKLAKRQINILKVNEETLLFNGLDENAKLVVEALINANENSKIEMLEQ